jgi:hypothetical protein
MYNNANMFGNHFLNINTVCPKSYGGVSNDYIVGMKHDRRMKQVSNERQTKFSISRLVELVIVVGREGGQAAARATYPR